MLVPLIAVLAVILIIAFFVAKNATKKDNGNTAS